MLDDADELNTCHDIVVVRYVVASKVLINNELNFEFKSFLNNHLVTNSTLRLHSGQVVAVILHEKTLSLLYSLDLDSLVLPVDSQLFLS